MSEAIDLATRREGEEVVYFFQAPEREDLINVGFSDDFRRRRRTHEGRYGQILLAVMRAGRDYETRIHRYFDGAGLKVRPSHYGGEQIVAYVEGLLERGIAVAEPDDLQHVPSVTWEALAPEAILRGRRSMRQLSLVPETVRERVSRAAKAAYHSSLSDEWYTPENVVEAARAALGGTIDLDPASCPAANRVVRATHYFSARVNGLEQEWRGRVFMNPPYSDQAQEFMAHLFREIDAGRTTEAVVLLNQNAMTSKWFHDLEIYERAEIIVLTYGRLRFRPGTPDQAYSSPSTGSALLYFGENPGRFVTAFEDIGRALRPIRFDTDGAA